ncbi:MAG: hypothetical protein Ct9H300mP32_6590 [Verrucomicrobiota bacterium]|nr:MAG: hypothetical protein Ct9H300mP32_6590 [Verrucomicrobiota bacterium]
MLKRRLRPGADALGFMFYNPSPRYLTPEEAGAIIRELPAHVARVGVFVMPTRRPSATPPPRPDWTRCNFTVTSHRTFARSSSSERSRRFE